jgi:heat shock protein HslJ
MTIKSFLVLAFAIIMGDSSRAASVNPLEWTEWTLTTPSSTKPTLVLTDKGIGGFAGCNRFSGSYTLKGNTIVFSKLVSTKRACEPALMKLEQQYTTALGKITAFNLSKDKKSLVLTGQGARLTFALARVTPSGFKATERRIVNVQPDFVSCFDEASKQCLLLEDITPSDTSWGKFTEAKIQGFKFEPGYSYQLEIAVEINARTGERRLRRLETTMQRWEQAVTLAADQRVLEIAPNWAECAGKPCLQLREPGQDWQNFPGVIRGFTYKPDYSYKLLVKGDATSGYTLVRLLEKNPVVR